MELITSILITIIAIVLYQQYKAFTYWSSRGIVGPKPWPIIGTNIYYIFNNKVDVDLAWAKSYGRTYGIYDGTRPVLRTSDCDILKQVFIKQFPSFTDRNYRVVHQDNPRRWLLWLRGDLWAIQRALISPLFSASKMRNMIANMSTSIDRFLTVIKDKLAREEKTVSKLDVSKFTLDTIASGFFGIKLDTYKEPNKGEIEGDFAEINYKFAEIDLSRLALWMLTPARISAWFKFDLVAPSKYIFFDILLDKIIKQRRSESDDLEKKHDVFQALIDAKIPDKYEQVFTKLDDTEAHYNAQTKHEEMERMQCEQTKMAQRFRQFTDQEIRGQLTFFFLAGYETTALTLTCTLYMLANHPEVQQQLLDELQSKFGSEGEKLDIRTSSKESIYESLTSAPLLDAVISETLRMFAPILENNRLVTNDDGVQLDINGRMLYLPRGSQVSTNSFITHSDAEYFEDPWKFEPSRFYPENKSRIRPGSYMPFGLGPRNCAGMRFALLELRLAVARIMLNYTAKPAPENQYPLKFKRNLIFLQPEDTRFLLVPR